MVAIYRGWRRVFQYRRWADECGCTDGFETFIGLVSKGRIGLTFQHSVKQSAAGVVGFEVRAYWHGINVGLFAASVLELGDCTAWLSTGVMRNQRRDGSRIRRRRRRS